MKCVMKSIGMGKNVWSLVLITLKQPDFKRGVNKHYADILQSIAIHVSVLATGHIFVKSHSLKS